MLKPLTNLLPVARQRALVHEYYYRLIVVIVGLSIVLIGVAAILLLPIYVYLVGNVQEKSNQLGHIKATLSSADEIALSARLTALSNDAAALIALSKRPSISAAVRSVLVVPRPGISLSSFTYTPGAKSSTLLINGAAATRDSLRGYQLALQSMPSAISATLPVSVYAKDSDIGFTITIVLKP